MDKIDKKILRIHNYIYANEGLNNAETLEEFLKIFYCKIFDENQNNLLNSVDKNKIDIIINELFEIVKIKLSSFFEKKEKINLKEETIQYILNELLDIRFSSISSDIKGHILQKIIDRSYRESRGQFFTPAPVVDFIVSFIKPKSHEIGCDPACGTGGFLFSALEFIKRNESKLNIKNLYFYDISKQIIKLVSMRLMFEFSDIQGNYKIKDSIASPIEHNFDYILSNPPFGSQGKIISPQILSMYELGFDEKNNILKSQVPDILFIEKIIKKLKINGRAAIVLPDGDFENPSLQYVRKFLINKIKIDAIISLPDGTFIPYGTGVKSSILFFTKKDNYEIEKLQKDDYEIFYSKITKLGYTFSKHSKAVYQENGKIDEDYSTILYNFENRIISNNSYYIKLSEIISNNYILSESFYTPEYNNIIHKISQKKHAKLKDLVTFNYTKTKIEKDKKYNYIEIADINSYTSEIINSTELYGDELPSRASYVLKENDIIVATSGNSIGTYKQSKAIVPKEYDGYICTNGFTVLKAIGISPYYLLKFFNSEDFLKQILKYKYGTAIPCISREDFENILIEIPEQSKLIEIEEKIKKAIALRKEAITLLNE